ncbi:MAG TPA: EpsG family protein [Bacteroidales bacterium]|nr:EpsG family protein [Bacteroidales bacterium]
MFSDTSHNFVSYPSSSLKDYLLMFLLWPFLAFLIALKNYSQKESKKIVYIFLIYYGLTFVVGHTGNDAERYAWNLKHYSEMQFSAFFDIIGGMYNSQTNVDIVEPLISFSVSRFTSFSGLLFAAYAALFGFFYIKSINLIHKRFIENPNDNSFIHMAFFVMILPITAINGFRMWTASWIFFYGAYHVILYRDIRYFILSLMACLVHFSFLSANAILIIYFLVRNRNEIYFPLVIASFILPNLLAPVFQFFFGNLGGALKSRANMYYNESTILGRQEMQQQLAWFMKIGEDLILYYLVFAIIIIQLYKKSLREQIDKNLYSFLLLFLAFVNFGKSIPSFGGRFQIVFFMFATLYVFLFFLKIENKRLHLITWVGLFPMLLYSAIAFRQGSDSFNVMALTPGLGLPLLIPGISIADLVFN